MFVAKRIIWNNKLLKNFIYTSNALNCEEPKDPNPAEKVIRKKERKNEGNSKSEKPEQENTLNCDEFKDQNAVSNEEKKDVRVTTSRKSKFKKPKNSIEIPDSILGLSHKSVKKSLENVAVELGTNISSTVDDILNHLKEVEISKDSSKVMFKKQEYNTQRIAPNPIKKFRPLNIFDRDIMNKPEDPETKLKLWDQLEAEELQYLSKLPPKNYFEEQIALTEEGKLWHFPIDNDQGMEREAEISFTEHIFMEKYLEPWCPKRGPLRKFMEMVLIGLAKNHYYTIEEKKAHIDWFRVYFEEKKKLLQELGAMGSSTDRKEIDVDDKS